MDAKLVDRFTDPSADPASRLLAAGAIVYAVEVYGDRTLLRDGEPGYVPPEITKAAATSVFHYLQVMLKDHAEAVKVVPPNLEGAEAAASAEAKSRAMSAAGLRRRLDRINQVLAVDPDAPDFAPIPGRGETGVWGVHQHPVSKSYCCQVHWLDVLTVNVCGFKTPERAQQYLIREIHKAMRDKSTAAGGKS